MTYIENFKAIRERIDEIARLNGRSPDEITILAVSKNFDADNIQKAISEGILLFGENRLQEARAKIPLLKGDFRFHLVGHLQSNKAKEAVKLFDLIHSIDSLSTAQRVDIEAARINKVQKILIQVNTSGEESKNGIPPEKALALCKDISMLPNIELSGLMTIGPFTDNTGEIRASFILLKRLLKEANERLGLSMKELSMGMSSDYTVAVEEGATLVRIGTSIFGKRSRLDGFSQ